MLNKAVSPRKATIWASMITTGTVPRAHGASGKGDGFYALMLPRNITMTNLTELAKKNSGVFPFTLVYETIDGRQQVQAHGTRVGSIRITMPKPLRAPKFSL